MSQLFSSTKTENQKAFDKLSNVLKMVNVVLQNVGFGLIYQEIKPSKPKFYENENKESKKSKKSKNSKQGFKIRKLENNEKYFIAIVIGLNLLYLGSMYSKLSMTIISSIFAGIAFLYYLQYQKLSCGVLYVPQLVIFSFIVILQLFGGNIIELYDTALDKLKKLLKIK